jgi:hypothetical protein
VTRVLAVCFVLMCCLPVLAVQGNQVMYTGGTVPGLNTGTVGRLDMASETALLFEYSGSRLAIPYAAIDSFEIWERCPRYLSDWFCRSSIDISPIQVAIFEVSKRMPRSLNAVLRGRAPRACSLATTCGAKH